MSSPGDSPGASRRGALTRTSALRDDAAAIQAGNINRLILSSTASASFTVPTSASSSAPDGPAASGTAATTVNIVVDSSTTAAPASAARPPRAPSAPTSVSASAAASVGGHSRSASIAGQVPPATTRSLQSSRSVAEADTLTLSHEASRVVAVLPDSLANATSVFDELAAACELVGLAPPLRISFAEFDYGAADVLEHFYSADIVLTDLTESKIQQPMFYQLGVRQSLGRAECIITIDSEEREAIERLKTIKTYDIVVYKLSEDDTLVSCGETAEDFEEEEGVCERLHENLASILQTMEVRSLTQRKRWFMQQLRKTCKDIKEPKNLRQELKKLERTLSQDPTLISTEIVLNLALAYRDIQDYDSVIRLVESVQLLPEIALDPDKVWPDDEASTSQRLAQVALRVQYAFALNRRNSGDDRDRALHCLLNEVVNNKQYRVPDHLCLVGRVYKDKFIESGYKDKKALQGAIDWYREGFSIQQSEFAGINLATLLVVSGESFKTNHELASIGFCMNNSLGLKGNMETITDYWTVATVFEMSILAEDTLQALKAATCMFRLRPPTWHLKSTMNNIQLIMHERKVDAIEPSSLHEVFQFWMDLFRAAIDEEKNREKTEWPLLLKEPLLEASSSSQVFQPCVISVDVNRQTIKLANVCEGQDKLTAIGLPLPPRVPTTWEFSGETTRRVSFHNEDNVCLYLFANSTDFQLFFPCEEARARFAELINGFQASVSAPATQDALQDRTIEFEYERDERGHKLRLGRGSFGVVYSARDKETLQLIAVKEVEIKNRSDLQPLQEEISMHKKWDHSHIVRYLGSYVKDNTFYVFMEQVPGGSLSDLLRKKWGPITNESLLADYTRQILSGLKYLHERHVVHRDIKGDNILVNQFDGKLKLSDFGTSKRLAGLNPKTKATVGTAQFMAPEVINSERGYSFPADIWSVGCTVIEMATGLPPFHDCLPQAAMFKVGRDRKHPDFPPNMSVEAINFLESCFRPEPEDRPTSHKLLYDPFIKRKLLHRARSATQMTTPQTDSQMPVPVPSSIDMGRRQTAPAFGPRLTPSMPSSFVRDLSDASIPETNSVGLETKVVEHHETVNLLVRVLRNDASVLCTMWGSAVETERDMHPEIMSNTGASVTSEVLAQVYEYVGALIESNDELPKVQPEFANYLKELDSSCYSELLLALVKYKDIVLQHLKELSLIKPHAAFVIDQRISRAAKATRMFVQRLNESVQKKSNLARRKSIAVLTHQSSEDSQQQRYASLRRHHSDAPPPEDLANPRRARSVPSDTPEMKRAHFGASLRAESLVVPSDYAPSASSGVSRRPSVRIDDTFPTMISNHSYDYDYTQLESENQWLMSQLMTTSQQLHEQLSVALERNRAMMQPTTSMTSSGLDPTASKPCDAKLANFLRSNGFGEHIIEACARHEMTYSDLIEYAERCDVDAMIPFIGPRCRLWGLVTAIRQAQSGESSA
eukprot:m.77082 g.77082  ORF g.77082 m.77082 type:complete len:1459 (-) comp8130_c0_seq1:661-5037(-)